MTYLMIFMWIVVIRGNCRIFIFLSAAFLIVIYRIFILSDLFYFNWLIVIIFVILNALALIILQLILIFPLNHLLWLPFNWRKGIKLILGVLVSDYFMINFWGGGLSLDYENRFLLTIFNSLHLILNRFTSSSNILYILLVLFQLYYFFWLKMVVFFLRLELI